MGATRADAILKWALGTCRFGLGRKRYLTVIPPLGSRAVVYSRHSRRLRSIALRASAADRETYVQVFEAEELHTRRGIQGRDLERHYRAILDGGRQPLILDCGANVGLSVLHFSEVFPGARIAAIEPDRRNVEMLRSNTQGMGVDIVEGAIASRSKRVAIANAGAASNALQTTADPNGEIAAFSIAELLSRYPREIFEPLIVKIDIEGFEDDLFAHSTDWIGEFPLLIIELHDWLLPRQANSRNFLTAIADSGRDFTYWGEHIFSWRN